MFSRGNSSILSTYNFESAYTDNQGFVCIRCKDINGEGWILTITMYIKGNEVIVVKRRENGDNIIVYRLEVGKDVIDTGDYVVLALNNKSILIQDERHIKLADKVNINQGGGIISNLDVKGEGVESYCKMKSGTKTIECYCEDYGILGIIFDIDRRYRSLMAGSIVNRSNSNIDWNILCSIYNKSIGELKVRVLGIGESEYRRGVGGIWFKFKNKEIWVNTLTGIYD